MTEPQLTDQSLEPAELTGDIEGGSAEQPSFPARRPGAFVLLRLLGLQDPSRNDRSGVLRR